MFKPWKKRRGWRIFGKPGKLRIGFFNPKFHTSIAHRLALKGNPTVIQHIKHICLQNQIELGNGYGIWKENTVRIANFPSHTAADFDQLLNTLRHGL